MTDNTIEYLVAQPSQNLTDLATVKLAMEHGSPLLHLLLLIWLVRELTRFMQVVTKQQG